MTTKKAITALLSIWLVTMVAYLYSDHHDLNGYPKYAPNVVYQVKVPTRGDGIEPEFKDPKVREIIARMDAELPLKTVSRSGDHGNVMW